MPVNHLYALPADQDAQQTKYCTRCSSPFSADSPSAALLLDEHDSDIVCGACNARLRSARSVDRPGLPTINTSPDALGCYSLSEVFYEDDIDTGTSPASTTDSSVSSLISSISSHPPQATSILSAGPRVTSSSPVNSHIHFSSTSAKSHYVQASLPDPSVDITRLRVRSQSYHCLYPGATFKGTQKSGRNSYDVTVTIVVRPIVPLSFRE